MESCDRSKPPSTRAAAKRLACASLIAGVLALAVLFLSPLDPAPCHARPAPADLLDRDVLTFDPPGPLGLVRVLDATWGAVAKGGVVPNVAPARIPPGLDELDTGARKRVFLRSVLPYILAANGRIARERAVLLEARRRVSKGGALGEMELFFLHGLARRYRLEETRGWSPETDPEGSLTVALRRVDVVPPSLALAQAALESGWGSSRFAQEGNALFGQWVFSSGKGIVPRDRPEGATHTVARFNRLAESVDAYIRNLNTLWAYKGFREARARARQSNARLDAYELARELLLYSERRELYVEDIHRVIRGNRLARFDKVRLQEVSLAQLAQILSLAEGVSSLNRFPANEPDA